MKRFLLFLLLFSLLLTPLWSHGESCALCNDTGYMQMPVFGTNELVWVNCTACSGGIAAPVSTAPAATQSPAQAADTLQLPDPCDYANGYDKCIAAQKGYAAFTCTEGYDIDGYLEALTASTGLEITGVYDIGHGFACFYQLTHLQINGSLYQDTCHATVFYYAGSGISLAAAPDGAVRMPDRASIVLPDPRDYAYGEITDFAESNFSIRVDSEEGFALEEYIQQLRYEYGFDVEAVERDEYSLNYALYNPDIDTELFPISFYKTFNESTRQLEIYYRPEENSLRLYLATNSIIQLPSLSDEIHYVAPGYSMPELPNLENYTVERGDSQCSYSFEESYDWESYIVMLIEEGFNVTDIIKEGGKITYYLLKSNYNAERIHNDTSHLSVSYDYSENEMTLVKDAYALDLPKSGQPVESPGISYYAGSDTDGYDDDDDYDYYDDDDDDKCSYCHGTGERTCLSCNGKGYIDCGACYNDPYCSYCNGRGQRSCPSFGCHNGKQDCSFCGGDGIK